MKRASRGASKKKIGRRAKPPKAPRGRFFTLAEVAAAVGGTVVGDPAMRLTDVAPLESAEASDLSWLGDPRRARQAADSRAGALLVASEAAAAAAGRAAIVVPNPLAAFALWLLLLRPPRRPRGGVSRRAHVDRTARIGRGASIAAGATVGARSRVGARTVVAAGAFVGDDVEIGEDCWIHPNAAVLDGCRIGARCVLQAGAVVGSDGFGYVWDGSGHRKVPQVGIVRIEEDVEVGANAAIDRATLGETVIGRGTKIDNLVQVGHNTAIGEHSLVCGQAGIAGSARLGSRVTLAGQAGIGDHVTIGDGATITGRGGIPSGGRVAPGEVLSGYPPAPHREFLKRAALVARLPDLVRRLEALEKAAGGRGKDE